MEKDARTNALHRQIKPHFIYNMHDIALALMAVQAQTTDVLSNFPTKAATEPIPETATET